MKKRRILAIILALVILAGILPAPVEAKTEAAQIERFEASYVRYGAGSLRYMDVIRIAINPDAGTAEMSFKRKILFENIQYYSESEDEDDRKKVRAMRELIENNYGRLQCKATVHNKNNDAIYGWKLSELNWYTEPYYIYGAGTDYDSFLINSNKVDQTGIYIPGGVYKNGDQREYISFYRTTAGLDDPDSGFTMLKDNFGFSNRYSSFFNVRERYENKELTGGGWYYWGNDGYLLDQKTFNALIKDLSNREKGRLFEWLNDRWGGSCMGMSIVSGLLYREKLNRDSFNDTAAQVYDFDPPVKNKPLLSAIQYYMWKGNLETKTTDIWRTREMRSKSVMKDLVDDMLKEKDPLYVLSFYFNDTASGSERRLFHAVLAYGAEKLDPSYTIDKEWVDRGYATRLYIYDPNSPDSSLWWYVAEDGTFKIVSWDNYAVYTNPGLCNYVKPEDYLNKGFVFPKLEPKQIRIELRSCHGKITIGDKTVQLDGNSVKDGGLSVTVSERQDAEEEGGEEAQQVTVVIDDVDPSETIVIETNDNNSNRDNNKYAKATVETADGFYSAGADDRFTMTLTISPDGSAFLKPKTSGSSISLAVSSDKTGGDLYAITAQASADSITVIPTEDGAKVTADKADNVNITVAGDTLRAQFAGESVPEDGALTVKTEGKKAQILKEDGIVQDEQEAVEPPEDNWGTAPEEGDFPGTRPKPEIPEKVYYYTGYDIVENWKWNEGDPIIKIRMNYQSFDGDTSPSEELTLHGVTTDPDTEAYRTYIAKTTAKYKSSGSNTFAEVVLKKKYDNDGGTGGGGGSEIVPPEDIDVVTWNLFYNRAEGITIPVGGARLTDINGNIGKNTGASAAYFDVTSDDTELKVTLKESILNSAKKRKEAAQAANCVIILPTYDSNGNVAGEYRYSLPVIYVEPKLRLTSTVGTIKRGEVTTLSTNVEVKKSTGAFVPFDLTTVSVTGKGVTPNPSEAAVGKLDISASEATAISIGIQGDDWSVPVTLKYAVKASANDVITATIGGKSFQNVTLNTHATGSDMESFEVDVKLNGKDYEPGSQTAITVTTPKKNGGFIISGIEDGKLTASKITISYPEDPSKLVKGTYAYALKYGKASYSLKIIVSTATLAKSVTLKTQTKMNVTTGQNMIIIPALKGISGTIDSDVQVEDERFKAEYDASVNQVIVSAEEGAAIVPNKKITTKLGLVVGGVRCLIPVTVTAAKTKPTLKIDIINIPKDWEDAYAVANVRSSYKLGDQTITIEPEQIKPVSNGKNNNITPAAGDENAYRDSVTGATIRVNGDNSISISGKIKKAGNIRISAEYRDGTVVLANLPIKISKVKKPNSSVTDNDQTLFTPNDWSWVAEGEGYGRKYFTSGKYVREDGRAVIYIDSADSPDGFAYQMFVMAGGAKQDNFVAIDYENGSSYVWASNSDEKNAFDKGNSIRFVSDGKGSLEISSDWIEEMYIQYEAPDGKYILVREKK